MRTLTIEELRLVSGGCGASKPPKAPKLPKVKCGCGTKSGKGTGSKRGGRTGTGSGKSCGVTPN